VVNLKIEQFRFTSKVDASVGLNLHQLQFVPDYTRREPLSQFVSNIALRCAEVAIAIGTSGCRKAESGCKESESQHRWMFHFPSL